MPRDSNWKIAVVAACLKTSYVFGSSSGSVSSDSANDGSSCFTYSTVRSRIVSVVSPRKSNFTRPICSTSSLSNWLIADSVPCAQYSGQKSVSLPGAISTPPACMPTLRVRPSSGRASATSSWNSSSASTASANAGSSASARSSVHGSAGLCGISFDSVSHFVYGRSSTRPASRTTAFAPSVPKVAICDTASWPYLRFT